MDDYDVTDAPAEPEAPPNGAREQKLRYSDADFLRIVGDECRRSVGFGEGDTGELARARIKSQEYRQGKIVDLAVMKGRSAAVDSTLSDAVDTLMPDVMEVFFGGDDVATFTADGEEDEAHAEEETAAILHAVFSQNDAFRAFHDAIQDALLNRTGLFHWWWDEDTKSLGSKDAATREEAAVLGVLAQQSKPWAHLDIQEREDGGFELAFSELRGKVCFKAVPSEDFTVAADTVTIRDTAYCALRDRPRVQDLIARGVDPKLARSLPHYSTHQDEMEQVRERAGEYDRAGEDGIDDMRVVEVRTHYLRIDADDDGEVEIWRVETDGEERILLQKERVTQIPFGALAPYLIAHRFYGESLFDKLAEVQRIKTVLLRMLLDSGYFALNQRMEVSEESASEFTIADLLNNAPNVPVRSKNGQAVRPIGSSGLGFDVFSAMEFMSTVAEQRSGVVRNAQGLNPDTLHDTASGAMQLISAAQKRVRFICRVLAETGVKDLFLGVHQMMREQFTEQYAPVKLKNGQQWKQIRPHEWPERDTLTIHVGVGSAGRERDLMVQEQALGLMREVINLQGGIQGPFVDEKNIYNRLKGFSRAVGEKTPELYWSDPTTPEAKQAQEQKAQQPDPETAKAQAQMQMDREKATADIQTQREKNAAEIQLAREEGAAKLQLERERMQMKHDLDTQQLNEELAMEREKLAAQIETQRQVALLKAATPSATTLPGMNPPVSSVEAGGAPG